MNNHNVKEASLECLRRLGSSGAFLFGARGEQGGGRNRKALVRLVLVLPFWNQYQHEQAGQRNRLHGTLCR